MIYKFTFIQRPATLGLVQQQLGKTADLVLNSSSVLRLNLYKTEHLCFDFSHFAKLQTVSGKWRDT